MTDTQLEVRKERAENGTLVISKLDDGFRVYSVQNPSNMYHVRKDGERLTCTCPDFDVHKADTTWRCKHILALVPWMKRNGNGAAAPTEKPADQSPAPADSAQQPPSGPSLQLPQPIPPVPVQMMMKRSVSPDGRIDSISVEFSLPVSGYSNEEIKARALATLELQKEIVGSFLKLNGSKASPVFAQRNPQPPKPANGDGGPTFARMIDVGRINTRRGESLCINFQVNGRHPRLFGSAKQLAEHITSAGYEIAPENIEDGLRLNLACRVVTKPTDDGKYLNVEKVLPLRNNANTGGNHGDAIPY
jgi:SWIM zinc finger